MFKRFGMKALSLVTAIAVTVFSWGSAASAEASQASLPVSSEISQADPNFVEVEKALAAIERIPDDVIERGPEAIMEWFNTNTEFRISEYTTSGTFGCISAVGGALVGLIFAPAKIAKIKDAIKAGGGTVKFVTKLLETYKVAKGMGLSTMEAIKMGVQDAAKTAGQEIIDALLGFFGAGAIYSACFE
ncbi:hypothetical protein PAALTS15_18061 [Paenibacillus alvei TS-15]|jgi:hypothetical protein|uniref:Uncharacterized protein n=1 Tax=Paenibacillus alvei TS-15 TaxID=1117108 RepID=S9SJL2_PAEAL|nr:hypothetical protein [Paenibacillus alvei]EPY05987.1 hypothetical protein PAALTS15_18061 [Paenibacillus alvei TS-15]